MCKGQHEKLSFLTELTAYLFLSLSLSTLRRSQQMSINEPQGFLVGLWGRACCLVKVVSGCAIWTLDDLALSLTLSFSLVSVSLSLSLSIIYFRRFQGKARESLGPSITVGHLWSASARGIFLVVCFLFAFFFLLFFHFLLVLVLVLYLSLAWSGRKTDLMLNL